MFLEFVQLRWCINVVTLFTSPPDLSVVFSLLFVFVVVVCLVLLSLVAAAFLANKDVYIIPFSTIKRMYIASGINIKFIRFSDIQKIILDIRKRICDI